MTNRIKLLGLPLDIVDMESSLNWVAERLESNESFQIITLNPEIVVQSTQDVSLAKAIKAAELVTPDGVGILWAAKRICGVELPGRVTGVDLTQELFLRFGGELRVYFLGGRPGVAERAANVSRRRYGISIAGFWHGYFDDPTNIIFEINNSGANVLLAGLGQQQEVFLYKNKTKFKVPILIGVGGTLDVLAGAVKRMPTWSQQLRLEWLLRVGSNPRRWPRAVRLLRFALLTLKTGRNGCQKE